VVETPYPPFLRRNGGADAVDLTNYDEKYNYFSEE